MFPLVETIKIINGTAQNLLYHQRRLDTSFAICFGRKSSFILKNAITVPEKYSKGLVKLRFLYNQECFKLDFSVYRPRAIVSLKIVEHNTIDYSIKRTNRSQINDLLNQKDEYDDILIVKNQIITDTSVANIAFYTGSEWLTPATPLLKGTCRQRLLEEGILKETIIKVRDLSEFKSFALINAMLCGNMHPIPLENINKSGVALAVNTVRK